MNVVWKTYLSMSFSGGLLILILLLGKRFLKDKISRQWQYYIWLVVILRLLLPFGPEINLLGKTYQPVDRAATQAAFLQQPQPLLNTSGDVLASDDGIGQSGENANRMADKPATAQPLQEIAVLAVNHVWLVWLVAALVLLVRKITIYQGFSSMYCIAGSGCF